MAQIRPKQRQMLIATVAYGHCFRMPHDPAAARWRVRMRTNGSSVLTFHARTGDKLVEFGLLTPDTDPSNVMRGGVPYIPTPHAREMVSRMRRK